MHYIPILATVTSVLAYPLSLSIQYYVCFSRCSGKSVYNGYNPLDIASPMNTSESIHTQIALPSPLYQALEQRAQVHGHSISNEIVTLLASLLPQVSDELKQEFAEWEAASDEDWLAMEMAMSTEVS